MAPSSGQIKADFNIESQVVLTLCTSIFRESLLPPNPVALNTCKRLTCPSPCFCIPVLAYALGPLFIGPLSEIFGRVRVLQIANAWLILFNFVTAWAPNKEAFIVFRFLAGLGGSAPLSIGGGVIGDVWRAEERGQAVAICGFCSCVASLFDIVTDAVLSRRLALSALGSFSRSATWLLRRSIQPMGMDFLVLVHLHGMRPDTWRIRTSRDIRAYLAQA